MRKQRDAQAPAIWTSDNFSYSIGVRGQGDESESFGLSEETMKLLVEDIQ